MNEDLIRETHRLTSALMKFFIAVFAWLVIGAILATGIVLAAKGNLWLLGLGFLGFLFAFAKYGCAAH